MTNATIHLAKTQLSRLIEKAERGEEVIISRGRNPVVRLVPIHGAPGKRELGLFKKEGFELTAAFFEPLPEEELERWE
jgi:prevent-host-death family protein